MIVTCPACSSRYKLDDSKIKGRGAKITCPGCKHRFVVVKDAKPKPVSSVPADLASRDFQNVGITWTVRKDIGLTYDVYDLATFRRYLDDGRVTTDDQLSYDNTTWKKIAEIDDLDAFFWDVWQRATAGEIRVRQRIQIGGERDDDEEDEDDAPTAIIGTGSSLAEEIRRAVQEGTPAPPSSRVLQPSGRSDRAPAPEPDPPAQPQGYQLHKPAQQEVVYEETETPKPDPLPEPARVPENLPAPKPRADMVEDSGGGMGMLLIALVLLVGCIAFGLWWLGIVGNRTAALVPPPTDAVQVVRPA